MARRSGLWVCLVAVLALSFTATACGGQASAPAKPAAEPTKASASAPAATTAPAAAATTAPAAPKVDYPPKTVTFIAPSKPGSGFDTTARAIAATLEKEKMITFALPVQNASSPPEGMATIVQQYKGKAEMINVGSITTFLNKASGASPYGHKDLTPVAALLSTYYGVVVRADSPYKTLTDLLKDLKEKPDQTPLCGGQSDDRIAYGALALAYGADLKKINYAAYAGGTEASAVLLEGSAKAEITTIDDIMGLIESKKVRALAVSGSQRLSGVLADVPTFKEAGVNLEWANFRFIAGGPQMPDYAVKYWQDMLGKMVKTQTWKDNMAKYRWVDNFSTTDLGKYMDDKAAIIDKVAAELGLKQ
ncbi:MAG TPA: tripartite tricarboxylate transporter substrate-binding protein [Chloroflexota bacterium]|nr:tripartite tricarboxylate transporter substrate-binding protein [Chloroflexota bacterium]